MCADFQEVKKKLIGHCHVLNNCSFECSPAVMPKRSASGDAPFSMEKKIPKYETGSLIASSCVQSNVCRSTVILQDGCRYKRTLSQPICVQNLKSASVAKIKTRRSSIRKIDNDTFKLVVDSYTSPEDFSRNALISEQTSSLFHDKASHDAACFNTSKTPLNQGISKPEAQQPPQALVNKKKPFQGDIIPPALQQSKGFITVTGDQMASYFQLIGRNH